MQTLPVSKAKDRLSELVEAVAVTAEQVTITRNGTPAAVMVGVDEWESLQESLYWLSQPGIMEDVAQASRDLAAGKTLSEEQIRAEFGVPKAGRL